MASYVVQSKRCLRCLWSLFSSIYNLSCVVNSDGVYATNYGYFIYGPLRNELKTQKQAPSQITDFIDELHNQLCLHFSFMLLQIYHKGCSTCPNFPCVGFVALTLWRWSVRSGVSCSV